MTERADVNNRAFSRPFPPERRLVLDTLRLGSGKPMMHAMLEIDVTRARSAIRDRETCTGNRISFTAFVLACIGRAVETHPEVHAMLDRFGRIVIFEDVDATVIVETDVQGRKFAFAHVVRSVNRRTADEITAEIRSVQSSGINSMGSGRVSAAGILLMLPGFVRRLLFRIALGSATFAKRHTGTLLVSSVGMFGKGAGWGFSAPGIHNLSFVIGGIATRPTPKTAVSSELPDGGTRTDGTSVPCREIMCLTISANHQTVDGAPFARFADRLKSLIESADGI